MSKLCIVYNFAQLYRESIFRRIDKEWDCEWYFGDNATDIKEMAHDAVRVRTDVKNQHLVGPLEWQLGVGKLIRQKEFDKFLMLGHPMTLSTWWILIQRRLFYRHKRVYLWSHGWYGRESFFKKWLKRAFFGMADHVFTYGQYAKGEAIKQGFNPAKITPIHNSLNHRFQVELRHKLSASPTYKEHFGNDNPTMIFIGRLTEVKRLDMALHAVKILKNRGENYNIVFIGSGDEHEALVQLTKNLGLEDNVWFYGACYDDTQNATLIYNADLCVAPGNVGLTAMHTMVFGTPVVTHGDFPWQMPEFEAIREGDTGAFFRRNDVESLADAISQWFATHLDRDAVRQACFKEIDNYWNPEYQLGILRQYIEQDAFKKQSNR